MTEEIVVNQSDQYQMNGALVGLGIGLASGLLLLGGLGGGIAGGVVGLFGGAMLGTVFGRLSRPAGRMLIGAIILVLGVLLIRNLYTSVSNFLSSPATGAADGTEYDGIYYEIEEVPQ